MASARNRSNVPVSCFAAFASGAAGEAEPEPVGVGGGGAVLVTSTRNGQSVTRPSLNTTANRPSAELRAILTTVIGGGGDAPPDSDADCDRE